MRLKIEGLLDADAFIEDAVHGWVSYSWQTADTANAGSYDAEWEVTFGDGSIETFPNKGFDKIEITGDI